VGGPNLSEPYGIVYCPINGFLYAVNYSSGTVTAYDQNGTQQTLSGSFSGLNNPDGITFVP
jgi:DNA-binding beta-propeller fold protein YncE